MLGYDKKLFQISGGIMNYSGNSTRAIGFMIWNSKEHGWLTKWINTLPYSTVFLCTGWIPLKSSIFWDSSWQNKITTHVVTAVFLCRSLSEMKEEKSDGFVVSHAVYLTFRPWMSEHQRLIKYLLLDAIGSRTQMKPVMKDRSHSHQEHTPKMARLGEEQTSSGNIGQPTSLKLVQDFLCKGKRRGGIRRKIEDRRKK